MACMFCDYQWESRHRKGCPHFEEKTVKFEVGDKVSVQGTVTQLWRHNGKPMCDVRVEGGMQPYCVREDSLTLVERPKKFEVGKKYKFPGIGGDEKIYMYLGDRKFYAYNLDTSIYIGRSDNLVPVD